MSLNKISFILIFISLLVISVFTKYHYYICNQLFYISNFIVGTYMKIVTRYTHINHIHIFVWIYYVNMLHITSLSQAYVLIRWDFRNLTIAERFSRFVYHLVTAFDFWGNILYTWFVHVIRISLSPFNIYDNMYNN